MPINGIENNKYDAAILKAKQLGCNLYLTKKQGNIASQSIQITYGWNTDALTKSKMINAFVKAVNDGLIDLSDKDLIQECKSYTRNDLIDDVKDPRLTTRHFDLLMAACICWQMKDEAKIFKTENYQQPAYEAGEYEGGGQGSGAELISTPTGGRVNMNPTYQQAPIQE